ncbi:MAG: hypothetical protein KAS59_07570 [Alphaproteobacteria bacterium]|nr:hypothetical protein [Alphaproteobacteria bacterium]MCK5555995.1 hypothetical protein [Alphaproteobacteria bacterium]
MGYFDGLTEASFKKDASGKTLFYPWGTFGSGFIIESEERHTKLRAFLKRMYMILFPAIIIIQITFGFWLNLLLLPVYFVWYFYTVKNIIKDLPKTTEKLSAREAYKNSAKSHNLVTLVILMIISLGFVAIGIYIWVLTGAGLLISYLTIGGFGVCSLILGYMIFSKMQGEKADTEKKKS